jgi:hypothetical protein
MNTINPLGELPELGSNFAQPRYATTQDRTIDAGYGRKMDVTTIKKPFPNPYLGGVAIEDAGVNIINQDFEPYSELYLLIHEDDHIRFGPHYTGSQRTGFGYLVDELTNRRIADDHYRQLTGDSVSSAGDYLGMIRERCSDIGLSGDESNYIIDTIRKESDVDYEKVRKIPVDLKADYGDYIA